MVKVKLEEDLGPDNIIAVMLRRRTNWGAVRKFIVQVQSTREMDERTRQKNR